MSSTAERGEDEEWRLIRQVVVAADAQAFSRLMQPYVPRLRGYLARFVRESADADDLTQEVLLTLWSQLHRFDRRGRFVAWMFSIAHREFLQHARRHRRYWRALQRFGREPARQVVGDNAAVAATDIETILDAMDADTRAMILLSRGMGLTQEEIAAVTGKPLGTVKSAISRATRSIVDAYA